MDLEVIRAMIRKSLKKQIREHREKLRQPPQDFSSYQRIFIKALEAADAPDSLIEEVQRSTYTGETMFDIMWNNWADIQSEMNEVQSGAEKRRIWNESIEFYIRGSVSQMLEEHKTPVDRHEEITEDVVRTMLLAGEVNGR